MPSTNPWIRPMSGGFRRLFATTGQRGRRLVHSPHRHHRPGVHRDRDRDDYRRRMRGRLLPQLLARGHPRPADGHRDRNEQLQHMPCCGPTATGTETLTLTLGCIPVTAGPAATETLAWHDTTGGTSTISWSAPTIVGQTVVFNGTVTAGRFNGDAAAKVTSGLSYFASVLGCVLFGIPVPFTTGLVDSLLLTH